MTELWFILAAVTALVAVIVVAIDAKLHKRRAVAQAQAGVIRVSPSRSGEWSLPSDSSSFGEVEGNAEHTDALVAGDFRAIPEEPLPWPTENLGYPVDLGEETQSEVSPSVDFDESVSPVTEFSSPPHPEAEVVVVDSSLPATELPPFPPHRVSSNPQLPHTVPEDETFPHPVTPHPIGQFPVPLNPAFQSPAPFTPHAPSTSPQSGSVPAEPGQAFPPVVTPPQWPAPAGGFVHNESPVNTYHAPVYNGPVYNGPVYIENAHSSDTHAIDSGRRRGLFDRFVKAERQKRQQWAHERNFHYQAYDSALVTRWRRGVFAARHVKSARAIVRAETDIGILEFFDVDDLVAIAALHTENASSVRVELRAHWSGPPVLSDITRIGELGGYEIYASDISTGQRFLWDPRLEGFLARLPQFVRVLWNEGPWVLAELPCDIADSDLDSAAVVVRELADLLRVLPPELEPGPVDPHGLDPHSPGGTPQRGPRYR